MDWFNNWNDADWGSFYTPQLQQQFATQANVTAPGIVETAQQIAVAGETIVDSIVRAMQQVQMTEAQRDMMSIQIERANRGLAPLDATNYAVQRDANGFPVPVYVPRQNFTPLLLLGAVGLGAVLLLKK